MQTRSCCYLPGEKTPTWQEFLDTVGPDILAKIDEVKNQTKEEMELEMKQIEAGLETLVSRLKPHPVPMPQSVWDSMMNCFGHRGEAHPPAEEFPNLNPATKKALIKKACPYDRHPEEWMLELGDYLVSALTSNEMVGFIRDLGYYGKYDNKNPAKLPLPNRVAQLAFDLSRILVTAPAFSPSNTRRTCSCPCPRARSNTRRKVPGLTVIGARAK
jgi:hypothetical protein